MNHTYPKSLRDELDEELVTNSASPSFSFLLAAILITYTKMGSVRFKDLILYSGIILIILPVIRLVIHYIYKRKLLDLETTAKLFKFNIIANSFMWSVCTLLSIIEFELKNPAINLYTFAFSIPFAIASLITLIYDFRLASVVQMFFILPPATYSAYLYLKTGNEPALIMLYMSTVAMLFFLIQNRKVHQQIVNRILYRIDSDNAYEELKENQRLLLLEKSKVQQSTKAATIYEISGELTHEINNPLSIVIGNIELAMRSLSSGKIDIPYIERKLKNSHNASLRINNIMAALRYLSTQNKKEGPPEKHSLHELVDQALMHYQEKLITSQIKVEFLHPGEMKYILCKPNEITQVILNILSNAVKALVETPSENRKIIIQLNEIAESKIKLSMSNTGIKISPTEQENLFNPEHQNKDLGFSGSLYGFVSAIGLNTTRNIVEGHGGAFYYDENQDLTTFVVELPLLN